MPALPSHTECHAQEALGGSAGEPRGTSRSSPRTQLRASLSEDQAPGEEASHLCSPCLVEIHVDSKWTLWTGPWEDGGCGAEVVLPFTYLVALHPGTCPGWDLTPASTLPSEESA